MIEQQQQEPKPKLYAIVELFGHQKIAGSISEQNFGGAHFVRVDVPEVTVHGKRWEGAEQVKSARLIEAHTRSFGGGAIYSINWCDESTAAIAAQQIQHEPLYPYSVRAALANLPDDQRNRLLGNETDEVDEAEEDDINF